MPSVLGRVLCADRARRAQAVARRRRPTASASPAMSKPTTCSWPPKWEGASSSSRVREGDRVTAGQVIARLDTRDAELAIVRAARGPRPGRRAAAPAAGRVAARGHPAGRRAGHRRRGRHRGRRGGTRQRPGRPRTVRGAAEGQRGLAQGARRRAGAARRGERPRGRPRASARARPPKAPLATEAPARGREEIEAARARVAAVDAQIATLEKAIADAVGDGAGGRHDHEQAGERRRDRRAARAAGRDDRPRPRLGRGVRGRAAGAAPRRWASQRRSTPTPAARACRAR